jgi:hypothetical protein
MVVAFRPLLHRTHVCDQRSGVHSRPWETGVIYAGLGCAAVCGSSMLGGLFGWMCVDSQFIMNTDSTELPDGFRAHQHQAKALRPDITSLCFCPGDPLSCRVVLPIVPPAL